MSNSKIQPLTDLERFDLLQAMFPGELSDDDAGWDQMDEPLVNKFDIDPEDFDRLVGHLVMCAPVLGSALSDAKYHVLGTSYINGDQQHFAAAVKREAITQEEDAGQ